MHQSLANQSISSSIAFIIGPLKTPIVRQKIYMLAHKHNQAENLARVCLNNVQQCPTGPTGPPVSGGVHQSMKSILTAYGESVNPRAMSMV